jgi:ABC-type multidrug transport system permease subunit
MKKNNLKTLWQLISINYKEFIREPGILFWSLAFPILMAWVLGIAFTKRGEMIETIACVESPSITSSRLDSFLSTADKVTGLPRRHHPEFHKSFKNKLGKITFRLITVSFDSAMLMLKRGETSLIMQEQKDSILYLFDPQSAEAKLNYAMLFSVINHERLIYNTESVKVLTQKGTRYVDFLIPGLLALGIMNGFVWGIGYGLIEIRTKKLLRRMVATPMKKSSFIFSHFFARISLSAFEAFVLFFFSWIYFRTQIQGSVLAFVMIFLAGSFCFAGLSILMASRTSSSRVGNALINLITMPMMVLSGIFFSYHNFPDLVIPFIQKLPLTLLADSLRGIMTEGTGIRENIMPFFVLSGMGSLCFMLGIKIYKWY